MRSLTFQSLRHSFNSEMASAGVGEELRMKLTGHATREQNKKYTHHELEPLRAAINRMPSVLMAAPSISLNAQLPVLALPALITLPKERKCHHEAGRPLCSWKIREPEIQSALMGGVRSVGARPVIR
jgi:hypothetical protein